MISRFNFTMTRVAKPLYVIPKFRCVAFVVMCLKSCGRVAVLACRCFDYFSRAKSIVKLSSCFSPVWILRHIPSDDEIIVRLSSWCGKVLSLASAQSCLPTIRSNVFPPDLLTFIRVSIFRLNFQKTLCALAEKSVLISLVLIELFIGEFALCAEFRRNLSGHDRRSIRRLGQEPAGCSSISQARFVSGV